MQLFYTNRNKIETDQSKKLFMFVELFADGDRIIKAQPFFITEPDLLLEQNNLYTWTK